MKIYDDKRKFFIGVPGINKAKDINKILENCINFFEMMNSIENKRGEECYEFKTN